MSELNTQQNAFVGKCVSEIENGTLGMALLDGEAGTGKSFTALYLIKRLIASEALTPDQIVVACPTDQLVLMWKQLLKAEGILEATVRTIHSFTVCVPEYSDDGKSFLSKKAESAAGFNLVLIDEIYMCPVKCITAAYNYSSFTICLGDRGQLLPIGEVGYGVDSISSWILRTTLTIQERQKDPELAALVHQVRVEGKKYIPPSALCTTNSAAQKAIMDTLLVDPDQTQLLYVAYRNVTVEATSTAIREILIDNQDNLFPSVGEYIRVKSVREGKKKVLAANTVARVLNIYQRHLEVDLFDDLGNYRLVNVDIEGRVQHSLDYAKKRLDKKVWAKHFAYEAHFLKWRTIYTSTIHSAQGRTLDTVIINLPDVLRCNTDPNILYTAVSRSRVNVMFIR